MKRLQPNKKRSQSFGNPESKSGPKSGNHILNRKLSLKPKLKDRGTADVNKKKLDSLERAGFVGVTLRTTAALDVTVILIPLDLFVIRMKNL